MEARAAHRPKNHMPEEPGRVSLYTWGASLPRGCLYYFISVFPLYCIYRYCCICLYSAEFVASVVFIYLCPTQWSSHTCSYCAWLCASHHFWFVLESALLIICFIQEFAVGCRYCLRCLFLMGFCASMYHCWSCICFTHVKANWSIFCRSFFNFV